MICTKWISELTSKTNPRPFSDVMAEHTLDELRLKAQVYQDQGHVLVYDVGVVKSDCAVPEDLRKSLVLAVQPLEDVSEIHQDWHPGSDGKVLNLVHPSLYPLIYGRTRILTRDIVNLEDFVARCCEGLTHPEKILWERPPSECSPDSDSFPIGFRMTEVGLYSERFQWLPCDVKLTTSGSAR